MRQKAGVAFGAGLLVMLGVWQKQAAADDKEAETRNRHIRQLLETKIVFEFKGAPLGEVLKYVKVATTSPDDPGVPIYVEPAALKAAGKTLESPVMTTSRPGPILLRIGLRNALRTLGLTYKVEGGLLKVVTFDPAEPDRVIRDQLARNATLRVTDITLETLLKAIKAATSTTAEPGIPIFVDTTNGEPGIPIFVDPVGLQKVNVTMKTRLKLAPRENETWGALLKRATDSLGLTYRVRLGLLTITSKAAEDTAPEPAKAEAP